MTVFEHAMIGVDGALAVGLHRRGGWQMVALAACAAALPDWDGLTLLFGSWPYAQGHRVWGHNLLVGTLLAAALAALVYRFDLLTRTQRWLGRRWAPLAVAGTPVRRDRTTRGLAAWVAVGVVATYSHLLADLVFSYGDGLPEWRLPLLWPLADTAWAWPLVRWGDVGTTVILAAGMFAMLRWRGATSRIAARTLAAVVCYVAARGLLG